MRIGARGDVHEVRLFIPQQLIRLGIHARNAPALGEFTRSINYRIGDRDDLHAGDPAPAFRLKAGEVPGADHGSFQIARIHVKAPNDRVRHNCLASVFWLRTAILDKDQSLFPPPD